VLSTKLGYGRALFTVPVAIHDHQRYTLTEYLCSNNQQLSVCVDNTGGDNGGRGQVLSTVDDDFQLLITLRESSFMYSAMYDWLRLHRFRFVVDLLYNKLHKKSTANLTDGVRAIGVMLGVLRSIDVS